MRQVASDDKRCASTPTTSASKLRTCARWWRGSVILKCKAVFAEYPYRGDHPKINWFRVRFPSSPTILGLADQKPDRSIPVLQNVPGASAVFKLMVDIFKA